MGRNDIVIVDYGAGNLRSVEKAFARVGAAARISADPEAVGGARAVVLPGVGAFAKGMDALTRSGLAEAIRGHVARGLPYLGICLGLQFLFEESEERLGAEGEGPVRGLGILPGRVRRFPPTVKVPQMGWNRLEILQEEPLFAGVPQGAYVYFLHSYYAVPQDPGVVAARARYGVEFAAAVQRGNVCAIQFHPEKSSGLGLQILANFARWAGREPFAPAAAAREAPPGCA